MTQLFCDQFHQGISYVNWRPKGSQDWLLIYTDGGAGQFSTRLGTLTAREGEVVLYGPGEMQDYRTSSAAQHWDLSWAHFRLRPLERLAARCGLSVSRLAHLFKEQMGSTPP